MKQLPYTGMHVHICIVSCIIMMLTHSEEQAKIMRSINSSVEQKNEELR